MFSDKERCQYGCNQLADVICQLRFPQILTINANPPVLFQEEIRGEYPKYLSKAETPAPKLSGLPGNLHLENQPATINYQFSSADGIWRVNLTSGFISLACNQYTTWEDFAKKLDAPLAAFIKIYKPAFFERIGLRYLNFISRQALNLEGTPFRDLFQPTYLGILGDEDINEQSASRCSVDAEISLSGGCRAKIHAGPGIVKRNGQTEKEVKFILDQDLFMTGNIPVNYSAGALETLHRHAYPIFRGAITDLLHNAMDPEPI
jgi:uncharacterized protein (TIGR04255 family)